MFTALAEQITGVLQRLRGRGVLSESDVTEALREIRRHLLEADVSFEVTRGFVERVRERAVGALAIKSVSPGQQVTKLVHDELAALLGSRQRDLEFRPGGPDRDAARGVAGLGEDDHGSQAGAPAQARAEGAVPGRGGRPSPCRPGAARAARCPARYPRLPREWRMGTGEGRHRARPRGGARG